MRTVYQGPPTGRFEPVAFEERMKGLGAERTTCRVDGERYNLAFRLPAGSVSYEQRRTEQGLRATIQADAALYPLLTADESASPSSG